MIPDRGKLQRLMLETMEAHPFWKRKVDGTPLENDLPVRAATVAWEILETIPADPYDLAGIVSRSGVSQRDLAQRLGLSEARVSQMLADDSNVTVKTIRKVLAAIDEQRAGQP